MKEVMLVGKKNCVRKVGMLGALLLSTGLQARISEKPNIIFILCDDMGYGDLACYGQKYIKTPNLDRMASEGMLFTQAYAGSPVSAPSRATLMTGQHTGHTEVRGNKEYWSGQVRYGRNTDYAVAGQHPYDPEHVILPEIMKDQGYTTGMFGKWAGGYEGSVSTPDKRGIDEYFGFICQFQAHLYYPNFLNRYSKALGDTGVVRVVMDENIKYPMQGSEYGRRPQYSARIIHEKAMEWFQNDKNFKGDNGSRYNAVANVHAQFAAMITRLDGYVGEILQKLEEKGLSDNTLVIFSSDNGPHEEGGADPAFFGRDGKLRGLKRSCHEGGIRVPFIAKWPGKVPAGVVNDHQLAFYDIMPTFCDLAGVKDFRKQYGDAAHPRNCFDGISFAPTLLGKDKKQKSHPYLYWEFNETQQIAVRKGDWKLIVKSGKCELYDLATDIHEDHDVSALHPEIVSDLKEIVYKEHVDSPLFPITLPK
mgnify:FL=1